MSVLHPKLSAELPRLAADFAQAQPFRHVVIDAFLAPELAEQLLADFPSFESRYARNEMGEVGGKAVRMDMPDISAHYAALDRYLQTPEFLQTISQITGIPDLLYDPDYVGGGTHENVDGQGLDPHVDFNYLPKTNWHRRLNLIVYLNREWELGWGGCLDLHSDPWSSENDQIQTLLPLFNRCVIFETNEISWHGFRAITLPPERKQLTRKSVAIYLYTRERPAAETAPSHATIYVPAGLPRELKPGQELSEAQWLDLRRRFAQLKGQLKFLYQREMRFSREREEIETALSQARAGCNLPLQGFVVPVGATVGYWPDGWIGAELQFAFKATRRASELKLDLWAPPQLDGDQELAIDIDGQQYTLDLRPGNRNALQHALKLKAGDICTIRIRASRQWVPSPDGQGDVRPLAYRLVEAILE